MQINAETKTLSNPLIHPTFALPPYKRNQYKPQLIPLSSLPQRPFLPLKSQK